MTSLLSFNSLALFLREIIEAQLKPLPGARPNDASALSEVDDEDDKVKERELEYFYWGLFPVY